MPDPTDPNQGSDAPTVVQWELTQRLLDSLVAIGAIAFENPGNGWRLVRSRVYPATLALTGGDEAAAEMIYRNLEAAYREYASPAITPTPPFVFVIP